MESIGTDWAGNEAKDTGVAVLVFLAVQSDCIAQALKINEKDVQATKETSSNNRATIPMLLYHKSSIKKKIIIKHDLSAVLTPSPSGLPVWPPAYSSS